MANAKSHGALAELDGILEDVGFANPIHSVSFYTAQSIFQTRDTHAFIFSGEVMQFRAKPGEEVMLVVDLNAFPNGVSIGGMELSDLDKKAIDWSFELIAEKVDGSFSRLSPFDLVQIKKHSFDYTRGELSHIARLKFSNIGAAQDTRFNIGLLKLV